MKITIIKRNIPVLKQTLIGSTSTHNELVVVLLDDEQLGLGEISNKLLGSLFSSSSTGIFTDTLDYTEFIFAEGIKMVPFNTLPKFDRSLPAIELIRILKKRIEFVKNLPFLRDKAANMHIVTGKQIGRAHV